MIMHTQGMLTLLFCALNLCAMEKSPSLQERALAVCMKHHFSHLKKCKNAEEREKYIENHSQQLALLHSVQINGESVMIPGIGLINEPAELSYVPFITDDEGNSLLGTRYSESTKGVLTFFSRIAPKPLERSECFRRFAVQSDACARVSPCGSRYAQILDGSTPGIDIGSIHPAEKVFMFNSLFKQSDCVWLTDDLLAACGPQGIAYFDVSKNADPGYILREYALPAKARLYRVSESAVVVISACDSKMAIEVFCRDDQNKINCVGKSEKLGTLVNDTRHRTPLVFHHEGELVALHITQEGKFSESRGAWDKKPMATVFPNKTKLAIAEADNDLVHIYDIITPKFILCGIIKAPTSVIGNIFSTANEIIVAGGEEKNNKKSLYVLSYSMSPSVHTLLDYVAKKSVHDGKSEMAPT